MICNLKAFKNNWLYIFLYVTVMIYLVFSKLVWMTLSFTCVFIIFLSFIKQFKLITFLVLLTCVLLTYGWLLWYLGASDWNIKSIIQKIDTSYNLLTIIINYVQKYHDQLTSDFLLLMVLNYKTSGINNFYNDILNLGVVHLFVVSGLHLSVLNRVINKFLPKSFSFIIISIYALLLGLSFGVLRVLIGLFLRMISKKTNDIYQSLNHTCISGIIIYLMNPWTVFDLGFQMSFIGALVLNFNAFLTPKIKPFYWLINSFMINLMIGPIILDINNKINLLTIFNSWLLTPLVLLCYFVCIIVLPFQFLWPLLTWIIHLLVVLVEQLDKLSFYFYLNLKNINNWFVYIYYMFFIVVFGFIYQQKMPRPKNDFKQSKVVENTAFV